MDTLVSTNLIGQPIVNSPSTIENILGMFQDLLKSLEAQNMTVPGASVALDESEDNSGETLHLLFSYTPAPGIEQILAKVSVPV
jgi:hypothetical protein